MSGKQDCCMSPIQKRHLCGPLSVSSVFLNVGNDAVSIKEGYRFRVVDPYRLCKVLIISEILKAAHCQHACTQVLSHAHITHMRIQLYTCQKVE